MGHVEYLLGLRKTKPAILETGEALPDLPGLNRQKQQDQIDLKMRRRLYTQTILQLRATNKKILSTSATKKKAELAKCQKEFQARIEELLPQVGPYTEDERKYGFKEHGHGF